MRKAIRMVVLMVGLVATLAAVTVPMYADGLPFPSGRYAAKDGLPFPSGR